uniref:Uncharacterized protein n=1 Tax=Setaria viridis TaxID=4556 RepID=A0A4U6T218_SETVI|nr:hypothetical protein SEVIR_9G336100v2 [Setaria viridis]
MCRMTPNSAGLAPAGHITTVLAALPRISHSASTAAPSPSTTLPGGASAATPWPRPPCPTTARRRSPASPPRAHRPRAGPCTMRSEPRLGPAPRPAGAWR